jgi:hypothetical protein
MDGIVSSIRERTSVKQSISVLADITKMVIIGSLAVVLATGVGLTLLAVVTAQKLN